ncbi:hypothetical protein MTP99_013316 [Tenebrio molitor]|jgi:hypothetical protein|nr:hypothetical protein MTP99_013316 [Tenebrio molitor]
MVVFRFRLFLVRFFAARDPAEAGGTPSVRVSAVLRPQLLRRYQVVDGQAGIARGPSAPRRTRPCLGHVLEYVGGAAHPSEAA